MQCITATEAAALVEDGDTITTEGFLNSMFPEKLVTTLEDRFLSTGSPKHLTLFVGGGKGDGWGNKGLNHFAHKGFVRKAVGSHFGVCRKLEQMIADNLVAGYNLPQGVISHLFRACAARQPGIITRVGLGTYIDPRVEDGSKMNALATEELVRVMEIGGEDYLFYRTHPIDIAFLRGTSADENGNISIEREAVNLDVLPIALATKSSGGKVVFQVERMVAAGTIPPRLVKIPGILVDYVVVSEPEFHQQTLTHSYNPAYSGEIKVPMPRRECSSRSAIPEERKVIQRRAAFELKRDGGILNLGIGIPDGVVAASEEQGIPCTMVSTIESGVIGGWPAAGLDFGAAVNPEAIIDMVDMFSIYDGGALDVAVLGMGEVDRYGNVNVTKFGPRAPGAGGFIDISQNAKKVVFTGTFTADGLQVRVGDRRLTIVQEGKVRKLVDRVTQISFSGAYASRTGQEVVYITERAVFRLENGHVVLTEIAPGLDLQRDVIAQMGFAPPVSPNLRLMDESLFR